MKTIKSYVVRYPMVGVSSGAKILGHIDPEDPRPVLAYVGEGGRALWTRRVGRIAPPSASTRPDLDLHPGFDRGPDRQPRPSRSRAASGLDAGQLAVDPLYTYHGTTTRASDLHEEGAFLNMLSAPCMDAVPASSSSTTSTRPARNVAQAHQDGRVGRMGQLVGAARTPGACRRRCRRVPAAWGSVPASGAAPSWDLDLEIGRFDEETGPPTGRSAGNCAGLPGRRPRAEAA